MMKHKEASRPVAGASPELGDARKSCEEIPGLFTLTGEMSVFYGMK